jgi:uncharacterized membrane protein YgcG
MKNLNKAILIALGMALAPGVMASADDDVTIRMMEVNEYASDAVTRHIELPEAADDRASDHAADGLEAANRNRNRNRNGQNEDADMDDDDRDYAMIREREMEREREQYREREMDRSNHIDVEHGGTGGNGGGGNGGNGGNGGGGGGGNK